MVVSSDPIYDQRFLNFLDLPDKNAKSSIIKYLVSISTPELFRLALEEYQVEVSEADGKLIEDAISNFDQLKSNTLKNSSFTEENLFNRIKQTIVLAIAQMLALIQHLVGDNNGTGEKRIDAQANLFSDMKSTTSSANSDLNNHKKSSASDENKKPNDLKALLEEVDKIKNNIHPPQQQKPFMNNVYLGVGLSSAMAALGVFIYFATKPSGVNAISDQNDDIYCDGLDDHRWYNNMY